MQQFTNIDDTVFMHFGSNDTRGSGDDGASPVCDVRLCGAAASAAPVFSPTPVLLTDAGYPDGSYEVAIVASVANGFADGSTYAVFCSLAVDSQTPTGFVGLFTIDVPEVDTVQVSGDTTAADNLELQYDTTGLSGETFPATQGQVGNLSTGAAGLSVIASTFVLTTGAVETGSITSTEELDESYHVISDDTNTTDLYYQFDVGSVGVATQTKWNGYVQSNNDVVNVFGWDWSGSAWKQIGTIEGSNPLVRLEHDFDMTTAMTGTAGDLGLVRFRLQSSNASITATDRVLCQFTNLNQTVGYADGRIWVDSAGDAGSELYVNGTADNPCPWANAKTINSTLSLNRFHIANGNSLTLDVTVDGYSFNGDEWDLDLGSQSCNGALVQGADVSGTGTGALINFDNCGLSNGNDLTISGCHAHNCAIGGDITLTAATTYMFDKCFSAVAGTATPSIDFGAAVGDQAVNFRHYSGGIEIKNMGQTGTDNMSLEGDGQYILNANCTGGTLAVRGSFSETDNAGGAVTVVEDANTTVTILDPMISESVYTVAALANAPSGTTLVTVAPIQTNLTSANFTTFGGSVNNVSIAQNASGEIVFAVTDAAGDAIDLSGKTLHFNIHGYNKTILFTLTTAAGDIVISGASNNQVTVAITTTETVDAAELKYKLWNTTDDDLLGTGNFGIKAAPQA